MRQWPTQFPRYKHTGQAAHLYAHVGSKTQRVLVEVNSRCAHAAPLEFIHDVIIHLVCIDAGPGLHVLKVSLGKLQVGIEFLHVKIDITARLIGVALVDEGLNEGDDISDMLGGLGLEAGEFQAEQRHRVLDVAFDRDAVTATVQGAGAPRTVRARAIRGPAGDVQYALAVIEDVSDRKRMEAQLLLADRMASVGTLAAGVAHEINNPLSYLVANLDYAIEELHDEGILYEGAMVPLEMTMSMTTLVGPQLVRLAESFETPSDMIAPLQDAVSRFPRDHEFRHALGKTLCEVGRRAEGLDQLIVRRAKMRPSAGL